MDLQWIQCPGCYNFYDENMHLPKTLNCGHTVCYFCLEKQEQKILAPCCRNYSANVDLNLLSTNTHILDYLRNQQQVNTDLMDQQSYSEENQAWSQPRNKSFKQLSQNICHLTKNIENEKIRSFKDIEKRIGQIESLVGNQNASHENASQINRIITEKNQIIANLECQIQSYKQRLGQKKEEIQKQKQEMLDLQKLQTQRKNNEDRELESKLQMVQEIQKLNEIISQQKEQINDQKNVQTQVEEQLKIAEIKIENQEKELKKQSQLQNYKQEISHYTSQIYQLQDYIQQQDVRIFDLEKQNNHLIQQFQSCQLELEQIKENEKQSIYLEKLQINQEIKDKNNEIDNLQNKLKLKEQQILHLDQNQAKLTKENQELQKMIIIQQQQIEKKMDSDLNPKISPVQIKQIQSQNALLKEESKKLRQTIQQLESNEDHQKQLIKILEENRDKQERFINQLQQQMQILSQVEVKQHSQSQSQVDVENQNLLNKTNEAQQQCQCKFIDQHLLEVFQLVNEKYKSSKNSKTEIKEFMNYSLLNKFQIIILQIKSILLDTEGQKGSTIQNQPSRLIPQNISPFVTPKNIQEQSSIISTSRGDQLKRESLDQNLKNVTPTSSIQETSKNSTEKAYTYRKFDLKSPLLRGKTPDQFRTEQNITQKADKLKKQWNLDFDIDKKYQQIKDGYLLEQTKKDLEKNKIVNSYRQKLQ